MFFGESVDNSEDIKMKRKHIACSEETPIKRKYLCSTYRLPVFTMGMFDKEVLRTSLASAEILRDQ